MWTSTLDLKPNRVLLTRLLGFVYPNIYYSSLSPLRVANVARPTLPSASWVRVRNRLAGISGSDLPLVHADTDIRTSVAALPHYKRIYPGHEVVGEVIEIGEDVEHLHVGDRVVLQYSPNCLSSGAKPVCRACSTGNYNLCEYGRLPGPQPIGGGWSEEMLLHEQQLFRLPNELSDEQGVMLEPTAIALHALLRHLPQANDDVLVIGAGTIGLLTLHLLRTLVPKARISILARYPFQVEYATRLGADHIIYPVDPYAGVQRATHAQLYKGMLGNRTIVGGYDVIYDTVGQQKTLHHALRWLRTRGTMILVSLNLHMMQIDPTPIWHQEMNLLGSLSHGREIWPLGTSLGTSTFSAVTDLLQQKRIQPEQLISHRFAINTYKDALLAVQHKKRSQAIKVLFDYALHPASAVPNVRASARAQHPELSRPQGDAFMEAFVQAQNARDSQQDPAQEAASQANSAQETVPPKILDTPLPQAFPNESWQTILNRQDTNQDDVDEDTDPTMPVVRAPYRPGVGSRVVESPQTPIPPAMEPSHTLAVETPETDESEANSLSAQPTREPQQAEMASELSLFADHAPLEFPVEIPTNEEELVSSSPEVMGMNTLTEEQLPTQTVLDSLFDTDTSSMPEFLAQLSNLDELNAPAMPVYKTEDALFADGGNSQPNVETNADVRTDADAEAGSWAEASSAPTAASAELAEDSIWPDGATDADAQTNADVGTDANTEANADVQTNADAGTGTDTAPRTDAEASSAPTAADSTDSAGPLDATAKVGAVSISAKPKARRKRKTSSSAQTSDALNKDEQDEKKQTEGEMIQEAQSEQAATQATEE